MDCTFTDNTATTGEGGGLYSSNQITVVNGIFTDNEATGGGGAYFLTFVFLNNCTFTDNEATTGNGGGALLNASLFTEVLRSTFTSNTAANDGGGAYFSQTGILTNNVFANNTATANGGGLYLLDGGRVTNSTIYNNTATTLGGGIYAAYASGGNFNLQNSLLISNTAADAVSGPQVYINNADAANDRISIQHNLIAGGSDPMGTDQGVVYLDATATTIMQANTVNATDAGTVFVSIMAEDASMATDPNYLRLIEGGPATNVGNNTYVNNTPTDIAGEDRIQGGRVDLGAYESATKGPQTIEFTLATPGATGTEIALTATASSGLPVSYASNNTAVATVMDNGEDGFVLQLLTAGTAIITASQIGNDDYDPAPPIMQTITVRTPVILRVATEDDAVNPGTIGGDGTTWASATTLATALSTASIGDQIWIKTGTYTPATLAADATTATEEQREMSFSIPAEVRVYGGFAGTETAFDPTNDTRARNTDGTFTNETILSGDLLGNDLPARPGPDENTDPYNDARADNSNTVVTLAGANTTLDGLTITGGQDGGRLVVEFEIGGAGLFADEGATGAVIRNCLFTGNNSSGNTLGPNSGGGAYFVEAVTLTNCTFSDNRGEDQGAGAYFAAAATLTSCVFSANEATNGTGGGAYFAGAGTTLDQCTFMNNRTLNEGGGAYFFAAETTLTNSTFTSNEVANGGGGGAYLNGTGTITNCTFNRNIIGGAGAGIYLNEAATLARCTFTGNATNSEGGGAYFNAVGALIKNSIFAENRATDGAGIRLRSGGTVLNTTCYNNTATGNGGGMLTTFVDADEDTDGVQTSPFTLQNSLFFGNTAADAGAGHQLRVDNLEEHVFIQHNLIASDATGVAGISYRIADNLTEENTVTASEAATVFDGTDAAEATYLRLAEGSPAVNAGNNAYLNNGTPDDPADDLTTDITGTGRPHPARHGRPRRLRKQPQNGTNHRLYAGRSRPGGRCHHPDGHGKFRPGGHLRTHRRVATRRHASRLPERRSPHPPRRRHGHHHRLPNRR